LEINFSKGEITRSGFRSSLISNSLPRYQTFGLNDTMLSIKKQVYNRIKFLFTVEEDKVTDEWINENFYLFIKDNTPNQPVQSRYGSS